MHMAMGFARMGDEATIACVRQATADLRPLRAAGVRVLALGADRRLARLLSVVRIARLARQADVVHCTMWDSSLWGRLAAILSRRPVIVSEHTPGREVEVSRTGAARGQWIAWHNRLLDPFTFATVACARWQVPLLMSEGVDPGKLIHIPNGAPVGEMRARAGRGVTREELGIPAGARVVVQVARFQPQKNQRATLDAVARLRDQLGDVRAVFVGDGPERPALEAHAAALGADWALFLGPRSDVPALFALADLAVLPSFAEAMPMTIIEAMAVGTPQVATDVGDNRLVLEETGAGLCVPADDPDAFTGACRDVLADDELRARLAERARAGCERFDVTVMTKRYAALFDAALEGRAPASALLPELEAARKPVPVTAG